MKIKTESSRLDFILNIPHQWRSPVSEHAPYRWELLIAFEDAEGKALQAVFRGKTKRECVDAGIDYFDKIQPIAA